MTLREEEKITIQNIRISKNIAVVKCMVRYKTNKNSERIYGIIRANIQANTQVRGIQNNEFVFKRLQSRRFNHTPILHT